ncbi:MAG: ABC transporter permease [Actinomycetes bacterium]
MALKDSSEAIFSESPGKIALRILRKDKRAKISLSILGVIIFMSFMAPVYSHYVADSNPFESSLNATINVHGVEKPVLEPSTTGLGLGVTPIGPTWNPRSYFLGADGQGRDVMARLLYGGRSTLLIGTTAGLLCILFSLLIGIVAGYRRGWVDAVLSRILDIIWAFPVYLLAISLSVVLLTSGLTIGFIHLGPGSFALPILIIGVVYIPYVARPIRAQVLALREREFVRAAIGTGAKTSTIIFREILPNVMPSVVVFIPIIVSLSMLTESALSFLSIGVQPPAASWGTIINDGLALLYTRPMVGLAPGIMIVLTAAALNLYGDAVRDALDPKSRARGD